MSTDSESGAARRGAGAGAVAGRALGVLASLVRIVTVVFAAILVLHVVLVVTSANPQNGVAQALAAGADRLTLGLGDLFAPTSPSLAVILNYGLPAVVWLIIGVIVARLIGALGR
ncbi:hypothetical protein [Actinomycetospora sp. TBRC 11914]|uniref:hypothetical protein n=1 Tax=Actinomycetospora sp. TBRC 11914 TaxID=2729387 RepID=UPI00145EFE78|nr:hypothetical protein [Actinomycetospora sp. TBRC 11914]NMO88355.1 hypothetical protein [Actinomycetospora sp. TBRC 11914]